MSFLDGDAVTKFITSHQDPARIVYAHALHSLLSTATYPEGYSADSRWVDALVPSEAGRELLTRMSSQAIPEADLRLALFGLFWFQDPLIDFILTDLELIRCIIEKEAMARRFYWPLTQGRSLYDRCQKLGFSNYDNLASKDVALLLDGSPQGVYQVGSIVTGPLGILESQCARFFPPMQSLGLWHCPMLDCGSLHGVHLVPPSIPLVEAYRLLQQTSVKLWNTKSRWTMPVACWPYTLEEVWRIQSEMPLFLGECILGEDRTHLLMKVLISQCGQGIRNILREKLKKTDGNPATIAADLSAEQQLQLLLTLPDNQLKRLLDELVWSGVINVPAAEVREVDSSKRSLCSLSNKTALEMSSLGIRTTSHHPALLFRHLVWNAYTNHNELSDLDWRLQTPPGSNTQDELMKFLRTATPSVAIEKLILSSPRITSAVAEILETEIKTPDERTRTILEWKLGFDLPRDDRRLKTIRSVITTFKNTLLEIGVPESDDHRQALRGAGVNAFVELEGFLHEFISYNTWFLSSDHPRKTRFIYARNIAADRVPHALGKELTSGSESVKWNSNGNTLGTCLRFLQELNKWVESLPNADRLPLVRPDQRTHHQRSDAVTSFPFRHTELWADAKPEKLAEIAALLSKATSILNRADIPGVRNGLEHYREACRFPPADRIVSAAEAMREFVDYADKERLYPKLYWKHGFRSDPYGQLTVDFVDHSGTRLQIHLPKTIFGTLTNSEISQTRPCLVAPGNIFGLPNSDLIFQVRQESAYSTYWESYPHHKEDAVLPDLPDRDS